MFKANKLLVFILCLSITGLSLNANDTQVEVLKKEGQHSSSLLDKEKVDKLGFFVAHFVTDVISRSALIVFAYYYSLRIEQKMMNFQPVSGYEVTINLLGSIFLLYLNYKSPQLTDKYILDIKRKRSFLRNFTSWLLRLPSFKLGYFLIPVLNPLDTYIQTRYDADNIEFTE